MNNTGKTNLLIERMCAKVNEGRTVTADDVAEMLDTIRALRDLSDARVAAAYESCRLAVDDVHTECSFFADEHGKRLLERALENIPVTPADEAAALDRMIAEAVEEAVNRCTHYCTDCEQVVPIGDDGRGTCGHGRIYDIRPENIKRIKDQWFTRDTPPKHDEGQIMIAFQCWGSPDHPTKPSQFIRWEFEAIEAQSFNSPHELECGWPATEATHWSRICPPDAIRARGEGREDG